MSFSSQRLIEENETQTIVTECFSKAYQITTRHYLSWEKETPFLTVRSEIEHNRTELISLEMLTSFNLGHMTPFHEADAPERLYLHRLRSGWSSEGRHDIQSIEALDLERSWTGHDMRCERFGTTGTKPTMRWFPLLALEDRGSGTFWGAQLAWPGSWQMELFRQDDFIAFSGGLADREFSHWIKRLESGTVFTTPPAYLSTTDDGFDALCAHLTAAQETKVNTPPASEQELPILFNEWATSWGHPNHVQLLKLAKACRQYQCKYLVIDAGWYGKEEKTWDHAQGDWEPNSALFPQGLAATCHAIRALGVIPGLWFEFEVAGSISRLWNRDDLLLHRDGRPIQVGRRRFLDMLNKTRRLIFALLLFTSYVGASPITLLESSPFTNGIVVHLGCGNGQTTEALSLNGRFMVHALDTNPQQVDQAKKRLGQSNRVYVDLYNGKHLPYADNLINVIIVDPSATIAKHELKRVLQPLGWIITKSGNQWIKTVKAWPQGMDQWTHTLHGPDNNAVAQDAAIGPPRYLRWMSDPIWSRHHDVNPSMTGWVSANGRLYTINDETPIGFGPSVTDQWFLVAQNAFNGSVLWKRPIPHWGQKTWAPYEGGYAERFNHPLLAKRLVAVGDHVYVTLGYNAPVSIINGASGDVIGTLENSEKTDEILVDEHTIFLSINLKVRHPNSNDPALKQHRVAAYDRYSGRQQWISDRYTGVAPKKGHFQQVTHLFLAVGDTSVYLIDKNSVLALDKTTGQQQWQAALPVDATMPIHYDFNSQGMCKILTTANHVLVCQLDTEETADSKKGFRQPWTRPTKSKIRAYDTQTGMIQWTIDAGNWGHYSLPELFILNNQLRAHHSSVRRLLTVDLNSGKTVASRSTEEAFDNKQIASPAGQKTDWGRNPDRDYGLLSDILVAQDKHVFMRQRSIFGKAYTGPVWGGHLTSWSGLLDDSWFNRSVWLLDGIPYGELLAYSDQLVCGIRAYSKRGSKPMFEPGQEGYLLFGAKRKPLPAHKKGWISHTSLHPDNTLWEHRITTRLTGFVLTDTILFGVGTPDRIDADTTDQWASYKGLKEGVLAAFDTNTGQSLTQIELDSGPVYDGLAATNGRLVISLNNGTVQCYTSPTDK